MDLVSESVNDLTVRTFVVLYLCFIRLPTHIYMMKRQNTEFVGRVKREGDYQNGCELGSNDGTS